MPLILGLDIASVTGWALWDTAKNRSSIECGVYEFPDKASVEYRAAQLGLKLSDTIRQARKTHGRPLEMVVTEEALKTSVNGVQSTIVSCMLQGAVLSTVSNYGIAWGTVTSQTWRKNHFGSGYKPPQKLVKKKIKGVVCQLLENDWKQAAVNSCNEMGIALPTKKTVAHNAAEACLVGMRWMDAKLHAKRYHDRFMQMRLTS